MLNSNNKDTEDSRIYQIIDANLDRAREGLRVLEDWARFGLGKEKYVEKIKNFRQILGKNHLEVYKQSRNHNDELSKIASEIRYEIYTLEIDLLSLS